MPAIQTPGTPATGPREIKFHRLQQTQFKHRTLLIAWLCRRDGGWKNGNVTDYVHKMLRREGVHVPQSHVKLSFDWLVAEGYAISVVLGRRTREFILDPDVIIPTPPTIAARQARATIPVQEQAGATVHALPAAAPVESTESTPRPAAVPAAAMTAPARKAPPLPRQPDPRGQFSARVAVVASAVMDWWDEDADAAEAWVTAAAEALGADD